MLSKKSRQAAKEVVCLEQQVKDLEEALKESRKKVEYLSKLLEEKNCKE